MPDICASYVALKESYEIPVTGIAFRRMTQSFLSIPKLTSINVAFALRS